MAVAGLNNVRFQLSGKTRLKRLKLAHMAGSLIVWNFDGELSRFQSLGLELIATGHTQRHRPTSPA
jgi:hypothetical protein